MTPHNPQETLGLLCLQQIEDLERELAVATDSIARNALPDFEQSLWRQEMLAAGMRRSLVLLRAGSVSADTRRRLRIAGDALAQRNRTYDLLVKQARGSAGTLDGLCNLYRHAPLPAPAAPAQALRCEA